jgi:hypothetical protein
MKSRLQVSVPSAISTSREPAAHCVVNPWQQRGKSACRKAQIPRCCHAREPVCWPGVEIECASRMIKEGMAA